jgi:hypothetical protein
LRVIVGADVLKSVTDMQRIQSKVRSKWPAAVLAVILSLPMLYVLSFGPVTSLLFTDRITAAAVASYLQVYAPLFRARTWSDRIDDCLTWYCQLFNPREEVLEYWITEDGFERAGDGSSNTGRHPTPINPGLRT